MYNNVLTPTFSCRIFKKVETKTRSVRVAFAHGLQPNFHGEMVPANVCRFVLMASESENEVQKMKHQIAAVYNLLPLFPWINNSGMRIAVRLWSILVRKLWISSFGER